MAEYNGFGSGNFSQVGTAENAFSNGNFFGDIATQTAGGNGLAASPSFFAGGPEEQSIFDILKGFGIGGDGGGLQGLGSLMGGAGSLFGAYNAAKNNKLAEEQFGFQKDYANRNLANQSTIINDRLAGRRYTTNSLRGAGNPVQRKLAQVNGAPIG